MYEIVQNEDNIIFLEEHRPLTEQRNVEYYGYITTSLGLETPANSIDNNDKYL